MAQTVSIMILSNNDYETIEVVRSIPTEDSVLELATDREFYGEIECSYVSYNIGEGESRIDTYFSDDELIYIFEQFDDFELFEKEIESKGYSIERYSSGMIKVWNEEV